MNIPLFDVEGSVIGTYDTVTGQGTATNFLDQPLADDIAAQWFAVGYGQDAATSQAAASATPYAGNSLPADPIAAGLDVAKIYRTAQGVLYKYQAQRQTSGAVQYVPVQYQPGLFGNISPMMIAAGAALLLLALS